jgi:hypothetical protein
MMRVGNLRRASLGGRGLRGRVAPEPTNLRTARLDARANVSEVL